MSACKTPGDRFIPSRAGADPQFSAYKVRSGRRSKAENCRVQDNARTPLAPDTDSAKRKEVRERLFALRGLSSDSKVLNFKQTPTTRALKQKNGEFNFLLTLFYTLAHMLCSTSFFISTGSYWEAYSTSASRPASSKKTRKFPKAADKVLDAPNLIDDFC